MSATIIDFPTRPADRERLALVGDLLGIAIPPPASDDMELSMLLETGAKLLDNLAGYLRPDCSGLMDEWLDRLDRWEGKTPDSSLHK